MDLKGLRRQKIPLLDGLEGFSLVFQQHNK